jgi:hypothetical protein
VLSGSRRRQTGEGLKAKAVMTQKNRFVETISLGVLVALLALAGGCSNKASAPPKLIYNTDLKELRDRFNKDKGKVRLLLILSPT